MNGPLTSVKNDRRLALGKFKCLDFYSVSGTQQFFVFISPDLSGRFPESWAKVYFFGFLRLIVRLPKSSHSACLMLPGAYRDSILFIASKRDAGTRHRQVKVTAEE
jgi:hypothetical protein